MTNAKSLFIVGLVIVVGVLGYLLYQERQESLQVNLPGVKIDVE